MNGSSDGNKATPIIQRIDRLEKVYSSISSSSSANVEESLGGLADKLVQKSKQQSMESQKQAVNSILAPYYRDVEVYRLKENFAKLISFTVEFVEENIVLIVKIIGGALTGEFKFLTCVELIKNVVENLPVFEKFFHDMIEETVELLYNRKKKEVVMIQQSEKKQKKKPDSSAWNIGKK